MIGAAELIAIEEPHAALLARTDQEVLALVIEDDWRDVYVQVAAMHPVGVRRTVVAGKLKLLVGVELHADNRVAELLLVGIVVAVARAHVCGAIGGDGNAATSP